MSETPEQLQARMSRTSKAGWRKLTKFERDQRAHRAGIHGGRPVVIDHAKVKVLRAQGLKHREIAGQMKISLPSVYRILAEQ